MPGLGSLFCFSDLEMKSGPRMYWASIPHRLNPSRLCTFILGQVSQSCLGWSQTCSIVQADFELEILP